MSEEIPQNFPRPGLGSYFGLRRYLWGLFGEGAELHRGHDVAELGGVEETLARQRVAQGHHGPSIDVWTWNMETNYTRVERSVADPGCLYWIQYPGSEFFHPGSRIQGQKDPESGSASKNLSIYKPKNCLEVLGNVIRDVHPRS